MLKAVKTNGLVHQIKKKNINNQKFQKHETFDITSHQTVEDKYSLQSM